MYSRDVFPKYSSGGLPIPENYSGNAIRRTPPTGSRADHPRGGTSTDGAPRAHTPPSRMPSGQNRGTHPPSNVPLTVSPTFAAQHTTPAGSEPPADEMRERALPPVAQVAEDGVRGGADAVPFGESVREGGAQAGSSPGKGHTDGGAEGSPSVAATAQEHPQGGLSSILSAFLPPKPGGGGMLSQIGLEEALLLGLFLLLSQSDEEEDTLMLLALLFLYR